MRAPSRAVAVGALALLLLGSALVQDAASAALAGSVDPASRGMYDILVTPDDGAEAPALLAPNSLNTGEEQLSLDDVRAIRALEGVELAAPIAQIVVPAQPRYQTLLRIPVDLDQQTPAPESYRVVLRLLGDGGLGEQLLSENSFAVTLDRSNAPGELPPLPEDANSTCMIADVTIPCSLYPWANTPRMRTAVWMESLDGSHSNSGMLDGQTITLWLPEVLRSDVRMTLVDPIAEQALLGEAGDFLAPLVALGGSAPSSFEALESWARGRDTTAARQITAVAEAQQKASEEFLAGPAYAEYARIKRERGEEPDPAAVSWGSSPLVPMLLADDAGRGTLRAELRAESFGPAEGVLDQSQAGVGYVPNPPIPDAVRNGDPGAALPTVSVDASMLLDPVSAGALSIPWPGTELAPATPSLFPDYPYSLDLSTMVSVHDVAPQPTGTDGAAEVRVEGVGFHRLGGDAGTIVSGSLRPDQDVDPALIGAESVFGVVRAREKGVPFQGEYQSALTVGGFSAAEQRAITELAGGLPLGAYEPSDARLLAAADGVSLSAGGPVAGFGPLGLAAGSTRAIADISSAAFRSTNKVDAVRVRVAGVDSYDAAGIDAVTQAARDIEGLGYRATIVAGSRGENLRVSVGGYGFGSLDAATPQRVGELGVIEQRWSVLGPAAAAGAGIGSAAQLLLGTALLAVLGAFAVIELTGVPVRRREAEVLRGLGWRRGRIVRWFAAEYGLTLPLVAAAGLAAVVFAAEPALTGTVVAAVLLAASVVVGISLRRSTRPAAGAASESELHAAREYEYEYEHRPEARIVGAEPQTGSPPARRGPVRMPRSAVLWGVQRAWRSPADSVPRAFAVLAVMAPVAALTASAAEPGGAGLAGLLLTGCGVLAGLALLALLRRGDPAARSETGSVLAAAGWRPRDVRRAALAETLAAPLAAVFLGGYALWFVLSSAGVDAVNTAISAALVAGLAAAASFLLPARPATTRTPPPEATSPRKAALFRGIAS